jgi:hypothetical protein
MAVRSRRYGPAMSSGSPQAKSIVSHIAVQEKLDGKAVDWMEHVTEEQYRR